MSTFPCVNGNVLVLRVTCNVEFVKNFDDEEYMKVINECYDWLLDSKNNWYLPDNCKSLHFFNQHFNLHNVMN